MVSPSKKTPMANRVYSGELKEARFHLEKSIQDVSCPVLGDLTSPEMLKGVFSHLVECILSPYRTIAWANLMQLRPFGTPD